MINKTITAQRNSTFYSEENLFQEFRERVSGESEWRSRKVCRQLRWSSLLTSFLKQHIIRRGSLCSRCQNDWQLQMNEDRGVIAAAQTQSALHQWHVQLILITELIYSALLHTLVTWTVCFNHPLSAEYLKQMLHCWKTDRELRV